MRDGWRSLAELTRWRVLEFTREPEAVFWVFAFPLLLAVALGMAFKNRGPTPTPVGVEAPAAHPLVAVLQAADDLEAEAMDAAEADRALRTGRVAIVVVPGEPITFRYDSTRSESRLARLVVREAIEEAAGRRNLREVREVRVAERGARYIDFLIPGLLGFNIMGTGMWGVGFAIVRSRTRRLLKRFVASPMRRSHFLLGHMLARLVFLGLEVGVLLAFGALVFGVPFRGSVFTAAIVAVAGALTFSGLGVLVASRAKTIEGVSGLMNVVMVPMWIFSGVFFNAALFPDVLQPLIRVLPLTALNDSLRAVILDGAPLFSQGAPLAVLAAWGVTSFGIAVRIFRWN